VQASPSDGVAVSLRDVHADHEAVASMVHAWWSTGATSGHLGRRRTTQRKGSAHVSPVRGWEAQPRAMKPAWSLPPILKCTCRARIVQNPEAVWLGYDSCANLVLPAWRTVLVPYSNLRCSNRNRDLQNFQRLWRISSNLMPSRTPTEQFRPRTFPLPRTVRASYCRSEN
jgi:hypothetical protein